MSEPTPTNTESELVDFLHAVDARAPQELHERIGALVAEHSTPGARSARRRPALRIALGATAALAAVLLVALLLLPGGGSGAPALNVGEAAALTLRPATMSAPAENPHAGAQLAANVDGVAFPYWEDHFGWRSTGARIDHVGGRTAMTVFYANAAGKQIGYTIVSGTPPPRLGGGIVAWRHGTPYRVMSHNGSQLVVWLRHGRLCVVAGRGVHAATLLALASWDDRAEVT